LSRKAARCRVCGPGTLNVGTGSGVGTRLFHVTIRVTCKVCTSLFQVTTHRVVGLSGNSGGRARGARTILILRTRLLFHCIWASVGVACGLHVAASAFIRILARGVCAIRVGRVCLADVR
jgi:hypothetical protein